jgi:hypothetical protein
LNLSADRQAWGSSLYRWPNFSAINQTMTSRKSNIAVSLFSAWLISRVLSFSKYSLNFCQWDAINALSCRVKFLSMETPALDHVENCPLADFEHFGGFGCGYVLFGHA